MSRSSRARAHVLLLIVPTVIFGAIACGSKTGLLIDDTITGGAPDGASTVPVVNPDGGATMPANVPCKDGMFTLTPAQAEVIFVIDRSGSMAFGIDGSTASATNPSRWSELDSALTPVLQSIEGTVQLGAKFFPEPIPPNDPNVDTATACLTLPTIDVQPALNNSQTILDIFSSTLPSGGTPTAAAITASAGILSTADTRAVTKFMVLATDGAPNCAPDGKDFNTCVCTLEHQADCKTAMDPYSCIDDVGTIAAIGDAFTKLQIPTFVIGIGQQERPEYAAALDGMAVAGGRPRDTAPHYYEVLQNQDLVDAFTQIQASITQCTFVTPSKPDDPSAISISVNGIMVPNDPTHMNGWDYLNADFGEIELYGNACTLANGSTDVVTAIVACGDH